MANDDARQPSHVPYKSNYQTYRKLGWKTRKRLQAAIIELRTQRQARELYSTHTQAPAGTSMAATASAAGHSIFRRAAHSVLRAVRTAIRSALRPKLVLGCLHGLFG